MLSFLTASGLRDLSFRTRLGWRPHTINTDSLASLHSTQLARLTLTTFFFPRSIKRISNDGVSSSMMIMGRGRQTPTTPSRHSKIHIEIKIIIIVPIGTALYTKREMGVGRTPPVAPSRHSTRSNSLPTFDHMPHCR